MRVLEIINIRFSAIANINLDICTSGPILSPAASPSLKMVFVDAIKVRILA